MDFLWKVRFSVSVFAAVFVLCWKSTKGFCNINQSTFDLIIFTLDRDIKFMFERPQQMNIDAIFGLNFVEVHTAAALEHKESMFLNEKNRQTLEGISKICKTVRIDRSKVLSKSAFDRMIRPEIWNHTIFWSRGEIGRKPSVSPDLTVAKAHFLMYQGTPAEVESSRCLGDLLRTEDDYDCAVSKECAEMLVRRDTSRGYPLTHRLLYVQTAIAMGCKEVATTSFARLKKNYCIAIYQDLIDVEAMNFPPPSKDLAMEQIVLCGMEGYLEFLNEHYAKLITSWPNLHGCYSALGHRRRKKHRGRRSTAAMDYGCDNHASGVAAASLSLMIRAAVENSIQRFLH